MLEILVGFSEYLFIFPAAAMCIMPVRNELRIPKKKVYPLLSLVMLAICAVLTILEYPVFNHKYDFNLPYIIVVLMLFPFYYYFVKPMKYKFLKLFYVFISVMANFSFMAIINRLVDVYVYNSGYGSPYCTLIGLAVEWVLSITMFLIIAFYKNKKMMWLLNNFNSLRVWRIIWIVPVATLVGYVFMYPKSYFVMSHGRILRVSFVLCTLVFALFAVFQSMLYLIARTAVEKYDAEKRASVIEMQSVQYEKLRNYIENTRRLRHDFRHTLGALSILAERGQFDELCQYLREYNDSANMESKPVIYCENPAVNAVLGYYADMAHENHIDTKWDVSIPEKTDISDVDLCVIIGNLAENAIHGCQTVAAEKRYINFSVDMENQKELYFVMVNSFNGIVKKENNKFVSVKSDGEGIGVESVRAVTEKYHGTSDFNNDGEMFISRVMIRMDGNEIPE